MATTTTLHEARVESAGAGQPVTGAAIGVDGDGPAHNGGEIRLGRTEPTTAATARTGIHLAIESKSVLAVSGFAMLGFVVLHLGGNLLAFAGRDAFNAYARSLRELGAPLLGPGVLLNLARIVLAGALLAHLGAHARLLLTGGTGGAPATAGVGTGAAPYPPAPPWYAAHPLPVFLASGGVLALFLALHLAQLTFGVVGSGVDPADPYGTTVRALRSWPVALGYLVAGAAVGAHLLVGVWTGLRSLGLLRPGTARLARALAPIVAATVVLGLGAVPLAVVLGVLR